jgi:hypothetical protein
MANRTAWTGGNLNSGLGWTALFNSGDLNGMTNGQTVVSSVADITNGTGLDQFMDISWLLIIASSTIAAGSGFSFYLYYLNQDGSHYGDGQAGTPGTPASITPSFPPCAAGGIPAVASTTNMWGTVTGIIIAPGSFRVAIQNNCGFTLSGTQTVKFRSYNQNLNA